MMNYIQSNYPILLFIIILLMILYFLRKEVSQMIFAYGIPFIPSSDKKIQTFIEHLDIKKGQKFIDLGCGDGRVLEAVEKSYIQKYNTLDGFLATGIENAPHPYELSLQRREEQGLHYEVKKMDFFKEDFARYDIVYAYILPYLMQKIWKKMQKECKPGTLFYSNAFELSGEKYLKKIHTHKTNYIYVYVVGK